MAIILVGSEKGGTGKSTIATNLATWMAHEGCDVMLLDSDGQSSSKRWVDRRNESIEAGAKLPIVHAAQARGDVFTIARDMGTRYQHVVIDAGGRDSKELRTAMVAADVLLMPTKASQFDLETVDHVNQLVSLARGLNPDLKAYAVVAMAPTNPSIHETTSALKFLEDFPELELAPVFIREYKAYRDAVLDGRGVVELENRQAKAEIQLLGQALLDIVTP